MAETLIIINPRSANGRAGRNRHQIEEALRARLPYAFDVVFTERQGHATKLAREAAERCERIVVLGGDGTLNEVVNGLIEKDAPVNPGLALGVIRYGTGGDFARGLGIPAKLDGAIDRLAGGAIREVDVGKATYRTPEGEERVRYFINEAEIGMGAAVCEAVNRHSKGLGGSISFMRAILSTILRYRDQTVRMSFGGAPAETFFVNNVWLANGAYSGGGIRSAPRARLDDGLLDVVIVKGSNAFQKLLGLAALRSGAFIKSKNVEYRTASRAEAESDAPVPIEVEGEPIGVLPATFEVIGSRLRIIA
ncbi:MAG: diacylglycerol kinase family protein [Dehalococcoidia bacterium]|jgi:YegS/Rv2252/BmrU family lipid kinase